jgi:hypothetical protein
MTTGTKPQHDLACTGLHERGLKVTQDADFKASARLKNLLNFLCSHADKDPHNEISQKDIATEVLKLDKDFDPVADAHVRIEVGRLRTALALYYAKKAGENPERIEIPKGTYRPILVTPIASPEVHSDVRSTETSKIRILATFGKSFGDCSELIDLVATGIRVHCHNSPLASTGIMHFEVQTDIDREKAVELAKQKSAQISVHTKFVCTETDYRVFVEIRDANSTETKWCHRYVIEHAGIELSELARRISRQIATVLADPILGIVPGIALSMLKSPSLNSVLQAYNFMASQKLGMVSDAITGLEHLSDYGNPAPAIMGLLAELKRVSGRLNPKGPYSSAELCLELAEEALSLDVNDITCRMALGFARLNVGQTQGAFELGRSILQLSPPASLMYKAQMLMALANNEAPSGKTLIGMDEVSHSSFYMQEFARIIPKIRSGDLESADKILSNSLYGNIFWIHVFQAAVCADAGELKRAAYSANRIKKLVPGMEHKIAPLVTAFFPKENESHYIINGLRKSGIELVR